jgi:hypothetical protein
MHMNDSLLTEKLKSLIETYEKAITDKKAQKIIDAYKPKIRDMEKILKEKGEEIILYDFNNIIMSQEPIKEIIKIGERDIKEAKVNIPQKKKIKRDTIGVYVVKTNANDIIKLSTETGRSKNEIVNIILERIFDKEEKFTINIDAKKIEKTKLTSFLINNKIKKVIKAEAKMKNMSDTEYFNRLIEASINKYFK